MFTPDSPISELIPFSTHVSPNVIKDRGGDYLLVWRLEGLPFVGREEWELEHRPQHVQRLLQTLRAPDYVNVAFWVHDVRRRGRNPRQQPVQHRFNQDMSDAYYGSLSSQKIMNNELYLTMIYRRWCLERFATSTSDTARLKREQDHAVLQDPGDGQPTWRRC
jgi:type IV secretion system protein VirB4